MKQFCVYIMTNKSKTLYIGVTSNLQKRVIQHKTKFYPGFTEKYNCSRLVYFELLPSAMEAIRREKQLKGWLRSKKIVLIETLNPEWRDLSLEWSRGEGNQSDSSLRSE